MTHYQSCVSLYIPPNMTHVWSLCYRPNGGLTLQLEILSYLPVAYLPETPITCHLDQLIHASVKTLQQSFAASNSHNPIKIVWPLTLLLLLICCPIAICTDDITQCLPHCTMGQNGGHSVLNTRPPNLLVATGWFEYIEQWVLQTIFQRWFLREGFCYSFQVLPDLT